MLPFNPVWHDVRKQEKCSSLESLRDNFYKTQKVFESCVQLSKSRQKLDVILENKVVQKLKFPKNVNNTRSTPKIEFFNGKKN